MAVVQVVKEVMRCGVVEKPRTGFASRDMSIYNCPAGYTVEVRRDSHGRPETLIIILNWIKKADAHYCTCMSLLILCSLSHGHVSPSLTKCRAFRHRGNRANTLIAVTYSHQRKVPPYM